MNLREFEAHRPTLGRQLREMLESAELGGNWEYGWSITPFYTDDIRFKAEHPVCTGLVCVSTKHKMSMVDEHTPGCQGTWWWSDDLVAQH